MSRRAFFPGDNNECPRCVEIAREMDDRTGRFPPDALFVEGDPFWGHQMGACLLHHLKWYITRALMGFAGDASLYADYAEVEAVRSMNGLRINDPPRVM